MQTYGTIPQSSVELSAEASGDLKGKAGLGAGAPRPNCATAPDTRAEAMNPHEQLAALIDLAETVGIDVRIAPPSGGLSEYRPGALVRLKGREMLFLDPTASLADQIAVVAAALAGRSELQDRFIPPELREQIDLADAGA